MVLDLFVDLRIPGMFRWTVFGTDSGVFINRQSLAGSEGEDGKRGGEIIKFEDFIYFKIAS